MLLLLSLIQVLHERFNIVLLVLIELDLDVDQGQVGLLDELDDLVNMLGLEGGRLESVNDQLFVDVESSTTVDHVVVSEHFDQGVVRSLLVTEGTTHGFIDEVIFEFDLLVDFLWISSLYF